MDWTAADPDRAVAELPLGLRISGADRLLRSLAEHSAQMRQPWVWCAGIDPSGAAMVLAADSHDLLVLRPETIEVHGLATVWRVALGPTGITIDCRGFGLGLEPSPTLGVPEFLAHLAEAIRRR